MQVTLDLPDEFANEIFSDVPATQRGEFLVSKLIKNFAIFKKTTSKNLSVDEPLLDLPFEPLPSRGGIVTNELVNQLREQEGI